MLKDKKLIFVNISVFLLLFLVHVLDNIVKEGQISIPYIGIIKNVFLICIIFFYFIEFLQNLTFCKNSIFVREFNIVLYWAIGMLILSVAMALNAHQYTMQSFVSIFRLILPAIIAFLVLNILDFTQIYWIMVVILIVGSVGFIFAMGVENFTPAMLARISFFNSYSPIESHFFSPLSLSLCIFFLYYRRYRIFTFWSLGFVFLTFKRFMILFTCMVAIGSLFISLNRKIDLKWKTYFKIMMIILIFLYFIILTGRSHIFSMDFVNNLTMGRSEMFNALRYSDFKSYGLESSQIFLQRDIEMDLIKIYSELSILGVLLTINQLCNLCSKKLYSFLLVLLLFVEMLTSHFYDIVYFWIIFYITLGCVNYERGENIARFKIKQIFRFKFNKRNWRITNKWKVKLWKD